MTPRFKVWKQGKSRQIFQICGSDLFREEHLRGSNQFSRHRELQAPCFFSLNGLFNASSFRTNGNGRLLDFPRTGRTELSVHRPTNFVGAFGDAAAFHHFTYRGHVFHA
jgi:hypothetical protein